MLFYFMLFHVYFMLPYFLLFRMPTKSHCKMNPRCGWWWLPGRCECSQTSTSLKFSENYDRE